MAENTANTQPKQPNVWLFTLRVMGLTALLTVFVYLLIGLPTDSKVMTIVFTIIVMALTAAVIISAVVFNSEVTGFIRNSEKPAVRSVAPASKPAQEPSRGSGGQQRPEQRKQPAAA